MFTMNCINVQRIIVVIKLQINVLLNTTDVLFKMRYIFSHNMITSTRERERESEDV
jgi:hypothetical protein